MEVMRKVKNLVLWMLLGMAVLIGVYITSVITTPESKIHGIHGIMMCLVPVYMLLGGCIIKEYFES